MRNLKMIYKFYVHGFRQKKVMDTFVFAEKYGNSLIYLDKCNGNDYGVRKVQNFKSEKLVDSRGGGADFLYIRENTLYVWDHNYGFSRFWTKSDYYELLTSGFIAEALKKYSPSYIWKAGYLEGILFAIIYIYEGKMIAVDENNNFYEGSEAIIKIFKEIRSSLTKEQITDYLYHYSSIHRCLTWCVDNSISILQKKHISKLESATRKIIGLFCLILKRKSLKLPVPILFLILQDSVLSFPKNWLFQISNVLTAYDKKTGVLSQPAN